MTGKYRPFFIKTLVILCTFLLAGCPGRGDRLRLDETTQVVTANGEPCFYIPDAGGYQPAIIAINLRGTPSKQKIFTDNPLLSIKSGKLCIPSSFYHFAFGKKYLVEFVLISDSKRDEPRKFVVGVGVAHGKFYNFPLNDLEISRPYGSIDVAEESKSAL